PATRRLAVVRPLPWRTGGRPAAFGFPVGLFVFVGPMRLAGAWLFFRPAARLVATDVLRALALVLVVEVGAVAAPVVAHLTCSRRQASTRAWSPESSTSGTGQPRNSAGRV